MAIPQFRVALRLCISLLEEVSHGKRKMEGRRQNSAGLRSVLLFSRRPYLGSKLTGFHNQFRLIRNAHAPLRLKLGISEPNVIIAQTGSVSCVALDRNVTVC